VRLRLATALAVTLLGLTAWPATAAPNFHLFDQRGRMVSLSEFAGKPVVIYFWTSWSGRAASELAWLQSHRPRDIVLLAVNESVTEEAPASVKEGVEAMHLRIPVLFDDLGEAAHTLGIRELPGLVALDASHRVAYRHTGALNRAVIQEAVRAAVPVRAPGTGLGPASPRPA